MICIGKQMYKRKGLLFLVAAALQSVFPVLWTHFYNQLLLNRSHTLKTLPIFINFIENTQIPDDVILATLDVSSLYTNIPQSEGIDVICQSL